MATNWPNSVQTFTNPSAGDSLSSPSHADQHTTVNDTVEALQQHAGLVLVKTQTIGSGVSSVTVTGAFSATFENYRIVITNVTGSLDRAIQLQLGSETGTVYKYVGFYQKWDNSTLVGYGPVTTTHLDSVGRVTTNGSNRSVIDLYSPYLTKRTNGSSNGAGLGTSEYVIQLQLWVNTFSSYSSFKFFPSSGTMTGGTIRVYGYNDG